MAGRAMFTTVESTVTTVVPRMAATRVSCLVLEEGVSVLPSRVGALGDGDHPLVVVALDLIRRAPPSAGGARAVHRVRGARPGTHVARARPDQPALALL